MLHTYMDTMLLIICFYHLRKHGFDNRFPFDSISEAAFSRKCSVISIVLLSWSRETLAPQNQ